MAATLVKRVMLKITADDGDTEAKLGKIHAEAERLGQLHPELKVKLDSAEATAKMAVLRKELKATASDAAKVGEGGGFSGLVKGLVPAISEMSMFQKAMLAMNVATTFAEPLLAGVVVAAGGLASGLTAAGAGLGAFGIVAKGAFSQITPAVQAYTTAQQAAQTATTATAKSTALAQMKAAFNGLSASQKEVAHQTLGMDKQWLKFTASFTPMLAQMIGQVRPVLGSLLGDFRKLALAGGHALQALLPSLEMGLKSSGFQSFIRMLATNAGPAIVKLGVAIGHIAVGIGGILKAFMPMSQGMLTGIDHLTAKFAAWGSTLSGHSGFQSLVATFKTETPLAVNVLKNLGSSIATIVKDMTGLSGVGNSKTLLQIASPFTALLSVLLKANPALVRVGLYLLAGASGAKKLSSAFSGLQAGWQGIQKLGSLVTVLATKMGIVTAATEGETAAQGELDVAMDANPIGIIVVAIAALALGIMVLWKHSAAFRTFWIAAWHDIEKLVGDAVNFIKSHWQLIVGILTGPIGVVTLFIVDHWKQITTGAKNMIGDLVSFFKALPGRIVSALGNLGSLLLNAGKSLMEGLLHGIVAGWNDVKGFVGKIGGWISDLKGPITTDRVLLIPHGQAIMGGLLTGLESRMPDLRTQMARTTAAISTGAMVGAAAGGGTAPQIHITINGPVDADGTAKKIQQILLQLKRHNGGAALGLS